MKQHELNQMLEALTPDPERERELLDKFLQDSTRRKMSMRSAKKWKRFAAAAIAVALLTTGITALAVSLYRTQISKADENGIIWLSGGIAYSPLDSLSDEIKSQKGQSDHIFSFDSWDEAEKFIGLDLMNNPVLDNSPAEIYSLQITEGDKKVNGKFLVMTSANLEHITARGCYEIGEVNVNVESVIFTDQKAAVDENWDEKFLGYDFPEETKLEWESYTAPSGLEAQIMRIDYADCDTCLAAFSLNGIPTVVRTHSRNSYAEARDALIQILDGFLF